jgi:hypothetical protein
VKNVTGTFWPSPLQAALLVVALEDSLEAAVTSWRELRPNLDVDELEPGSFELIPLVVRNLTLAGLDDPELDRLKGIVRRTWVRNNLLVERTKEAAQALAADDISALFIEGVALASRFYSELGLRPTSFVDVLVNANDWQAAHACLVDVGWRTAPDKKSPSPPGSPHFLVDQHRNVCALRSRIAVDLMTDRRGDATDPLWERPDRIAMFGVNVCVPPPTETLFAVVVSNARSKSRKSLQWIVDAKVVLAAGIDWERFLELAERTGQVLRCREALAYLACVPGPKPPAEVGERLSGFHVSRRERFFYMCTTGSVRGLGDLPTLVAEHVGASANPTLLGTIVSFPGFLRERWSLAHTWEVPFAACRRALRRISARRAQRRTGISPVDS